MTPTPNPTASQVVADAITAYWADEERSGPNRGPVAHDLACGEAAAEALSAHGLLREPVPEGAPSIDSASVREAIGEVLADMDAMIEDVPIASDLHALTELADAAVKAATSPPSSTAVPYAAVATAVGDHSQTIRARLHSDGAPSAEDTAADLVAVRSMLSRVCDAVTEVMERVPLALSPAGARRVNEMTDAVRLAREVLGGRGLEGAPNEEQIDPLLGYLNELLEDDRIDYASYVTLHDYISTLISDPMQGDAKLLQNSEPSEEQIERAARAIWERYAGHGPWETLSSERQAPFRKDAHAALTAAAGVAPQDVEEWPSAPPPENVKGPASEDDLLGLQERIAPQELSVVRHNEWPGGSYQEVYSDGSSGPWVPAPPSDREKLIAALEVLRDRTDSPEEWEDLGDLIERAISMLVSSQPIDLDEGKLSDVVEDARRKWDGSGRHEPIAVAITRAVIEHLRGGS